MDSGLNTVLGVYTGASVNALTLIGSNDDSVGTASKVAFSATSGQTYRIAVDGKSSATGKVRLNWGHGLAPANDQLANATVASGASGSASSSSVRSTRELYEPVHDRVGFNSVWWTWTAPATGNLRLDTTGSSFDTVLSVYTGSTPETLVGHAEDDQAPEVNTSDLLVPVQAGQTYKWAVSGYIGATGSVSVNWQLNSLECSVTIANPFSDVSSGAFYKNAVLWLVQQNITSGTSPTTYSPNQGVTRAQMAAFLWRAAGEPTPVFGHAFGDVPPGVYYEDAVSWLAQQGITSGTSPGVYSPNSKVSRAQMATFLWRMVGGPYPGVDHDFYDVYSSDYYHQPVAWLVREGITTGTAPNIYSPNQVVTRAQMAVFLNRRSCG
ncbi:MAG: S-layer homology domain-containing protein [Microthrixaceae bacterium]